MNAGGSDSVVWSPVRLLHSLSGRARGFLYPGVELRLYRYVIVLAEVLNFTRAAARLHVAQPALSRQIRQLEEYLDANLFERNKRQVRLTAAGEAFTAEARVTLFHADRAVQGRARPTACTAGLGASVIRR